jgi:transcriptional regulator with XRE-family HTH domain
MNQKQNELFISSIGAQIKSYRKLHNMTQLDLAIKADIDVRQIQRLERGHTSATLKTLLKLMSGMDTDLGSFFQQISNENPSLAQ